MLDRVAVTIREKKKAWIRSGRRRFVGSSVVRMSGMMSWQMTSGASKRAWASARIRHSRASSSSASASRPSARSCPMRSERSALVWVRGAPGSSPALTTRIASCSPIPESRRATTRSTRATSSSA